MKKILMLCAFSLGTVSTYAAESFSYMCDDGREIEIIMGEDIQNEDIEYLEKLAKLICELY